MRVQRANRRTALMASYAADSVAAPSPQIVPATTATKAETSPRKGRSGKTSTQPRIDVSKRAKARNRTATAKPVSKAKVRPSGKIAKSMVPPPAKAALPQLVLSEREPAGDVVEAMLSVSAECAIPLAPVLVMREETAAETTTTAMSEMKADVVVPNEAPEAAENEVIAKNEIIPESVQDTPSRTFLQALAVQWTGLLRILIQAWNWSRQKLKSHQVRKRLRVCETISLGEKRFVAVIQVDGEQFLVGGSSSSVSTLAHLERRQEFSDVFKSRCEQDLSQA